MLLKITGDLTVEERKMILDTVKKIRHKRKVNDDDKVGFVMINSRPARLTGKTGLIRGIITR